MNPGCQCVREAPYIVYYLSSLFNSYFLNFKSEIDDLKVHSHFSLCFHVENTTFSRKQNLGERKVAQAGRIRPKT